MENKPISQTEAQERFIQILTSVAYDSPIHSMIHLMEKGPAGGKPPQHLVRLHQWYSSLDAESKERVQATIREAVFSAVFSCCSLLDGVAGGYPIPGQLSEFAVYLNIYQDEEAFEEEKPLDTIRVSNGSNNHEELHGLFTNALAERRGG